MTIFWGPETGHMQVGIEAFQSPDPTGGSTSVTVTVNYYVRSVAWGFNDGQTLELFGNLGGSYPYTMVSGSGQTTQHLIATQAFSVGTSPGGGPSYTFGARVLGNSQGGTPSQSIAFTVGARNTAVPGPVPIFVHTIDQRSAHLPISPPASDGGSPIIEYLVQVSRTLDFAVIVASFPGSFVVTGLHPGTLYYARAAARNANGWGPWNVLGFETLASLYLMNSNGDYVPVDLRYHNGAGYVDATLHVMSSGGTYLP